MANRSTQRVDESSIAFETPRFNHRCRSFVRKSWCRSSDIKCVDRFHRSLPLKLLNSDSHVRNWSSRSAVKPRLKFTSLQKNKPLMSQVVAYVDVFCGVMDTSESLRKKLISLGAKVTKQWSAQITHLIFKGGQEKSIGYAQSNPHVIVLSPLWVDKCLEISSYADVEPYEISSQDLSLISGLKKKPRSMSPSKATLRSPSDAIFTSSQPNTRTIIGDTALHGIDTDSDLECDAAVKTKQVDSASESSGSPIIFPGRSVLGQRTSKRLISYGSSELKRRCLIGRCSSKRVAASSDDILSSHSLLSPNHSQLSPSHSQLSPSHSQSKSNESQSTPNHSQLSPSHSQSKPNESQSSAYHSQLSPSRSQLSANHSQLSPSHSQSKPNESQSTPNHSQLSPSHSQSKPNESQSTPNHSQLSPSHSQSKPNESQSSANQSQVSANQSQSSANQSQSSANQSQSSANRSQSKPNESQSTPNCSQSSQLSPSHSQLSPSNFQSLATCPPSKPNESQSAPNHSQCNSSAQKNKPKRSIQHSLVESGTQPDDSIIRIIGSSSVDDSDIEMFLSIASELGGSFIAKDEQSFISHLIVGTSKRTLKVLFALARGSWILAPSYMMESLEIGHWLPEEDYVSEHHPRSLASHRAHQDKEYAGLLAGLAFYISGRTQPRKPILQNLIREAGGTLCLRYRDCDVCLGASGSQGLTFRASTEEKSPPIVRTEVIQLLLDKSC